MLDIFRGTTILAIVGIGKTIVQSTGEFEFSVGATGSFAACLIAKIMIEYIPNFYVALLITLVAALLIGYINSLLVINVGIRAWIAHLWYVDGLVWLRQTVHRRRNVLHNVLAGWLYYAGSGICL